MRAMTLEQVEQGMRLGKTLYALDGRVLLHRGTVLTDQYLAHLRGQGYSVIYVLENESAGLPEPIPVINERTRQIAVSELKETIGQFKKDGGQNLNQDWTGRRVMYNVAHSILSEIQTSRDFQFQLLELRSADDYTYTHSVQVAILGLGLAQTLGLPQQKMLDLAVGLMLHDIGKLLLPQELREPHHILTPEDEKVYATHCESGYGLLKTMGSSVPAMVKIVALQHHEHWDGSGYPRGLRHHDIHEYAQICAIVNTYDRLTTSNKFGHRALPHEALEYLMGCADRHFSMRLVRAFLDIIAPYPLGIHVTLNTGERGIVIDIPRKLPQRPVVRLLKNGLLTRDDIHLINEPKRMIVSASET